MLKMFHSSSASNASGGDPLYWEEAWSDGAFEESLRFCSVDPLRPLFERYVPPGDVLLEGGCGRGNYVVYQAARGVHAIGVDFAAATMRELRARQGSLPLAVADVARLPLATASVDAYYSGGVVEHFEEGPEQALAEAHRVLRPGGVLLVSVPYHSPLRRLLAPRKVGRGEWQVVAGVTDAAAPQGRRFFQYAYRRDEFTRILREHGFDVIETKPYSVLWGLYEAPVVGRHLERAVSRRGSSNGVPASPAAAAVATATTAATSGGNGSGGRALLHRLVVSEDGSVPVAGLLVRLAGEAAANMMMYACRRHA